MSAVSLVREGATATLLLHNPERGNALTPAMMGEAAALVTELGRALQQPGPPFGALVVRGTGDRAFCGGYDFDALARETRDRPDEVIPELLAVLSAFADFPRPIIAALNGHAVGGGALLASLCDLRYARRGALFVVPTTRIGILYPLTGLRRLVALLGLGRAAELLMLARPLDADAGLAWGLHNGVVSDCAVLDACVGEVASELAQRSPLAMTGTLRALRAIADDAARDSVEELHRHWLERCVQSSDLAEGIQAMQGRRTPEFQGR